MHSSPQLGDAHAALGRCLQRGVGLLGWSWHWVLIEVYAHAGLDHVVYVHLP